MEPQIKVDGGVSRFEHGDVLFGKLRPYLAKVARPTFSGVCSTELVVLRPREVLPEFLQYQLLTPAFINEVNSWTVGTKMPRLAPERLLAAEIVVPSIEDQRAIVRFLDERTAMIDALIDKKIQLLELLFEEVDGLVTSTLWPEQLPQGWTMTPLMRLTEPGRPIVYGIVLPGPNVPNGVLLVKGGDVSNNRLLPESLNRTTPEIEAPYARARLQGGDVVLTIRGRYGDSAIVPEVLAGANITQDIARISPAHGVSSAWLLRVIQSRPVVQRMINEALGAAVKGVNIRDVRRYQVPVPPLSEQVMLAERIDARLTDIRACRDSLLVAVERLREYRSSLITAAVTGRFDTGAAA